MEKVISIILTAIVHVQYNGISHWFYNYSRLRSSESRNLQAVFFSSYFSTRGESWSQVFLAETVETGDKNRDDFHFMQMQRVMSMWFIFRDNWSDPPSWTCFGFLAMMKFSPNQGPWFLCMHICVLKSKYPGEYLTKIQFHGMLRRYLSQNIDAITGTLWSNRFDIADSTGAHCWSQ